MIITISSLYHNMSLSTLHWTIKSCKSCIQNHKSTTNTLFYPHILTCPKAICTHDHYITSLALVTKLESMCFSSPRRIVSSPLYAVGSDTAHCVTTQWVLVCTMFELKESQTEHKSHNEALVQYVRGLRMSFFVNRACRPVLWSLHHIYDTSLISEQIDECNIATVNVKCVH